MKVKRYISRIFRGIVYFPKTFYVNFKALPLSQAAKFPIVIMGATKVSGIKRNSIIIDGNVKTGMIKIGAQKTSKRGIHASDKTMLIASGGGRLVFKGESSIGKATSICANGGEIIFGDKFSCNVNCFFYSQKKITFGDDVLLGWDVNIRDNDGHPMYNACGKLINPDKEINIDNHVWIASYVDIIKGVSLACGSIVGTRSLVTRSFTNQDIVIAGVPAREIKSNVTWKHE